MSTPAPDLSCFETIVDPDADPADWDEAIAAFLIRLLEKRKNSSYMPPEKTQRQGGAA